MSTKYCNTQRSNTRIRLHVLQLDHLHAKRQNRLCVNEVACPRSENPHPWNFFKKCPALGPRRNERTLRLIPKPSTSVGQKSCPVPQVYFTCGRSCLSIVKLHWINRCKTFNFSSVHLLQHKTPLYFFHKCVFIDGHGYGLYFFWWCMIYQSHSKAIWLKAFCDTKFSRNYMKVVLRIDTFFVNFHKFSFEIFINWKSNKWEWC